MMFTADEIARITALCKETRKEIEALSQKLAENTAQRKAKLHTDDSDMEDVYAAYAHRIRKQAEARAFRKAYENKDEPYFASENEEKVYVTFDFNSTELDQHSDIYAQEEYKGFTYVSEAEYLKYRWVYPVDGLLGWSVNGDGLYKKRNKIGGTYSTVGCNINTKKFEEAIVLELNGIPTINGIRYNMSKGNRLEPRYNVFYGENMDY